MNTKSADGATAWVDPDDIPELTDDFFERAEVRVGEVVVRRGRPRLDAPKRLVSLRLDQDVLERLRGRGPGWQTQVNAVLRAWLERPAGPREDQDAPPQATRDDARNAT